MGVAKGELGGVDDEEFVGGGGGGPDLAGAAEDLAEVRVGAGQGKGGKGFGGWVEADEGVGAEIGEPDDVLVVDVDGVGHGTAAGKFPFAPLVCAGVVHTELADVPFGDPDLAFGIGPERRAPWLGVGGSMGAAWPVAVSMRAMWLPAREA